MEELRECPGCGGTKVATELWGDWFVTECQECRQWQTGFHNDENYSKKSWNTRSSDAAIKELVDALDKACRSINDLIESSEGVAGLHLNGDVANWGSLRAGGRFESWLIEYDEACDVLAKHKPKD